MTSNFNPGIFSEFHATIMPVSNMDEGRKFYEEIIGLIPQKILVTGNLTVYKVGSESHFCIYVPDEYGESVGYESKGSFPNFRSDNIEKTYSHLKDKGVNCGDIQSVEYLKWFSFYDPDGNRIDVCEYDSNWLDGK